MGSSSIRGPLSASLSSGTCFANRLRIFALRMFGIRSCLQAVLITLATLDTVLNEERLLESRIPRYFKSSCHLQKLILFLLIFDV